MLISGSHKMLKIEIIVQVFPDHKFFRLRFGPILYWFIGLMLCLSMSEKNLCMRVCLLRVRGA